MRTLGLAFLLFVTLVSAAAIGATAQPAASQLVEDPDGRFTIQFPLDWKVITTRTAPSPVMGLGPALAGQPQTNVNVVVEDLTAPLSPATYAELARPKMAQVFEDFNVLDEGAATIAGRQAYYRYYTWRHGAETVLYQVQTYITLGRRAFVLTGTTINTADRIRRDVPVFGQIFETFTLITR